MKKIVTERLFDSRFWFLFFILIMIGSICLTSCASKPNARQARTFVNLTHDSFFFLLPLEGIERPMDMTQRVTASFGFGERNFTFNAHVRADETKIKKTFSNELGENMGELLYSGGKISFQSPLFPRRFRPEYMIADFQYCFYDPLLLRQALEDGGHTLEIQGNFRRIFHGEDLIIEIERTERMVRLQNHLRGYSYTIEGNFQFE
ncbi:MAG: DUF3261 domain-containing protein [Spirochaetes bacterium]|nr:DUF3261 domain-containing protein [Spirochaetota bacterium]